ncbi:MAG: hypothetical protein J6O50_04915 [Ruminiclostridium sp.]|nr:hypothetical protein [Ruminiclostridium sp.]
MSISEKLGRAAAEIGSAAEEAYDLAKAKYKEKVTPEKQAELKEKFDKGIDAIDRTATKAADKIEKGIREFADGFSSEKNDKK